MPNRRVTEIVLIGLIIGGILVASILTSGGILLWFSYAIAAFSLYLAWRLVRAVERVAESMETN